ncbi:MAG TPA: ABC transporter permease [Candidatus Avipropionibacterium avicola]|uniref:ABC transporter permease n=1 Tax=Candidatus Avipropionibacterium avicola TaxID=2840701 RepID=A0A9D1KM61_9ACTN|nr:ABC transporter permease [Candidatus Avipropionibacterium avicola]
MWSMLVVPPLLVVAAFIVFVSWLQNAELDSIEAQQLRWSEIQLRTVEHIGLTVVSAILVVIIAVPLGVALTRGRLRRAAPVVVGIANAGQAAPSVGLIVLLFIWFTTNPPLGLTISGPATAVIALTLYGLLPVLRNTIVGIQGVDPTLVEAARGIGMTSGATLVRIELPLAVPVIMSGVRTALVLLAGTASLACFIDAGGLGVILQTGISLFRFSLMVTGALLIALLALLIEWLGRLLEIATRPKGI